MNKSVQYKKAMLLAALEKTLGVVTSACKKCNVSRTSFYEYYNTDEKFKAQVDDLGEVALDFVESKLLASVANGSDTAAIFYLKAKGKKRGYIEKTETDVNHSGSIVWQEEKTYEAK